MNPENGRTVKARKAGMHTISRSQSRTRPPGTERFAHLERLRRMIEAGTYQVDLETLAARLVDEGVAGPSAT
jgi:anti-sigma28 factor (negative regulator of flagellin synthesis)